jgi:single-stranded-DNA-specific exonuclease
VFAFPSHNVVFADVVGDAHVRLRLRAGDGSFVNAVAFRCAREPLGQALLARRGQPVHAAGCLSIDRYQGDERVQFRLIDMAIPE